MRGRDVPSPNGVIARLVLFPFLCVEAEPVEELQVAALGQVLHEEQVLPCEAPGFQAGRVPLQPAAVLFPVAQQVGRALQARAVYAGPVPAQWERAAVDVQVEDWAPPDTNAAPVGRLAVAERAAPRDKAAAAHALSGKAKVPGSRAVPGLREVSRHWAGPGCAWLLPVLGFVGPDPQPAAQ
jgi:hypothetical protein